MDEERLGGFLQRLDGLRGGYEAFGEVPGSIDVALGLFRLFPFRWFGRLFYGSVDTCRWQWGRMLVYTPCLGVATGLVVRGDQGG